MDLLAVTKDSSCDPGVMAIKTHQTVAETTSNVTQTTDPTVQKHATLLYHRIQSSATSSASDKLWAFGLKDFSDGSSLRMHSKE